VSAGDLAADHPRPPAEMVCFAVGLKMGTA
jgi:hypothetical protein